MSGREEGRRVITINSETKVGMPATAGELRRVLESGAFPDDAMLHVVITRGQRDAEYVEIVFKWSKEA